MKPSWWDRFWPALLVAGVVGVCVALFFLIFERAEIEIDQGLTEEAEINRFFVAQRFLEEKGFQVESPEMFTASSPLPATDTVLILDIERETYGPDQVERLMNWVKEGGHLITIPVFMDEEEQKEDPLLSYFSDQYFVSNEGKSGELGLHFGEETDHVYTMNLDSPFRFMQYDDPENPVPTTVAENEHGDTVYMLFELGQGHVSMFTTLAFWYNDYIDEKDHAASLHRMVSWVDDRRDITIVRREAYPSLWELVREHGLYMLLSLAALLAAVIWRDSPRLGPILPDPPLGRRRLMEHVEAAARYYWSRHLGELMVDATREAMMTRLRYRRPDWLALSGEDLHRALAECSGLDSERIAQLLDSKPIREAETFATSIADLETVRRSL